MGVAMAEEELLRLTEDEAKWQEWFDALGPKERVELAQVLEQGPRAGPSPGPQTDAYNTNADVTGFGGAAGGGKSALISLLSVNEHTRVVIFRQDATQLGGLIDDLVSFYGSSVGLNRQASVFRMGDRAGHMIEWGGIGDPGSENRWKGRAHDLICADEATEMSEKKLKFLMAWMRSSSSIEVPAGRCRAIFTFNPPGSADDTTGGSGRWVIDFFAPWLDERFEDPAKPGEIRYNFRNSDGVEEWSRDGSIREIKIRGKTHRVKPQSRTFIPARVWDNPYLYDTNRASNPYFDNLWSMEEPFRTQFLMGDFTAGVLDSESQVIPTKWIDAAMDRWAENGRRESMSAVGVDVARGGLAKTVFARRHGYWWDELVKIPGADTPDGPSVAAQAIANTRDDATICIDAISVGASPYDFLKEKGVNVTPVVSNSTKMPQGFYGIEHKQEFLNLRSALWWLMRKLLDPENNFNPSLPKDRKLRSELISPKFDTKGGKYRVESKVLIKERLGYSPDDADAVVYSLMNIFEEQGSERLQARSIKLDMRKLRMVRPNKGESATWMSR